MNVGVGKVLIGALILAGAQLGCGGGSPAIMPAPATCGTVSMCGGDLTGTWKVLGGCLAPINFENYACPSETDTLSGLSYTGTVTIDPSSMTWTATDFIQTRSDQIVITPSACPAISDQTCAALDSAYGTALSERGGSAVCTGSTTCTCSATSRQQVIGTSGTYSLLGDQISFVDSAGASVLYPNGPFSYCVQNGLLHLIGIAITVGDGGAATTTIMSDIVLQLQ